MKTTISTKTNFNRTASLLLISILLVFLFGCKNVDKKNANSVDSEDKTATKEEFSTNKLGAAVLAKPLNDNTVTVSDTAVVIENNSELEVFPRRMETFGTIFASMKDVPDEFLKDVAVAYQQMFPQDSGLDLKKQQEVLNKLVQYKALLPVLSEHHDSASDDTNKGLDYFRHSDDYSVCDVIMYDVPRQTMEVVEHLLHNISDIGLHYAYPDEWAFNDKNSEVYKTMDQAIQEGLYDISSYEDILEEAGDEIYQRVIVQEYAYWLISTYWNLQEPYGPMEEEEWNIDNKKELLEKLPDGYQLVENTINKIMRSPSKEILEKFRKYNQ